MTGRARPTSANTPAKSAAKRPKPDAIRQDPPVGADGPNRAALEQTIAALEADDRLGQIDSGRVQIARSLAAAVDAQPDSPILWREYRAAEKALREEALTHGDPFDDLLAHLSAQVRDEEKPKAAKPRP